MKSLLEPLLNKQAGEQMHKFITALYPICRSLTGDGVRQTLAMIQEHVPLQIKSVPSGSQAFDWTVPKEWNIRDAYIKNSQGQRVVDFKKSNLHVLNYSTPINVRMSLGELKPHLFSDPKHPEWIPYLTSYYKENWGFCLSHNRLLAMQDDDYEVVIDSTLSDGQLMWGEFFIPGQTKEEILLSCYVCHPSLCNDNLSGVALTTWIAKIMQQHSPRYSYRFLFIPETIGAINWLWLNRSKLSSIQHGFIVTCVGDAGSMTYKKTRQGNALIDKAVEKVLIDSARPYKIMDFDPCGSDERQFSSAGINLPIGSLMRTPYGEYPEYHTSADNLDFVKADALQDSFEKYLTVFDVVEHDAVYISTNQTCEPQLGKRGLYRLIGSNKEEKIDEQAILWVLNFSDGMHSLLDIAVRSKITFEQIKKAANALMGCGLLSKLDQELKLIPANKSNYNFSEV